MRLTIDAWLERRDPRIRLLDADTGQEIPRLDADQVHELFESGELCPGDLADTADCIERIVLLLALMEDRRCVRRDTAAGGAGRDAANPGWGGRYLNPAVAMRRHHV